MRILLKNDEISKLTECDNSKVKMQNSKVQLKNKNF